MTLKRRSLLIAGAALAAPTLALAAPADRPSAAEAIARESALAAQDGKRLMVVFFSSWCAWCRPMDALLEEPTAARILNAHFRILHMRALETRGSQRAQQLAGADDLLRGYADDQAGLPFLAFVDPDGEVIATSISTIDGQNIGFPVEPHELDGFDAMLSVAAPGMTARERATIRAACVRVLG
jgi:thiol-disulfide isomerase/thioredoxin